MRNVSRKFSFKFFIGLSLVLLLIGLLHFRANSRAKLEAVVKSDSAYQPSKDDGAFEAGTIEEMLLHDSKRNKDLPVRIDFPKSKGTFPVIVFSHGAGASGSSYVPLTRFWATHGYVVIQPTHADSISLRREQGENARMIDILEGSALNDPAAWEARARDISFILDSFAEIERRAPELKGKMDTKRIGIGGHSYGAYTSQLIAGATINTHGAKPAQSFRDERPRAIMLLSPQGRNAQGLTDTSWQQMTRPMISMTGTLDKGLSGQPFEWRLDPFKFSPAGDKYQVLMTGANHLSFTGRLAEGHPAIGLLARRNAGLNGGADQKAIFDYIKMASLAFWDSYLKDETKAKEYLKSDALVTYSRSAVKLSRK